SGTFRSAPTASIFRPRQITVPRRIVAPAPVQTSPPTIARTDSPAAGRTASWADARVAVRSTKNDNGRILLGKGKWKNALACDEAGSRSASGVASEEAFPRGASPAEAFLHFPFPKRIAFPPFLTAFPPRRDRRSRRVRFAARGREDRRTRGRGRRDGPS